MIQSLRRIRTLSCLLHTRAMSTGYQGLLVPSKEKLDQLQNVDLFSSFHDSTQEVIDVDTDSDDPFDPADLVGLDNVWSSCKQNHSSPKQDGLPVANTQSDTISAMTLNWLHSSPAKYNLQTSRRSSISKHNSAAHKSPRHSRSPSFKRSPSPHSLYSTPQGNPEELAYLSLGSSDSEKEISVSTSGASSKLSLPDALKSATALANTASLPSNEQFQMQPPKAQNGQNARVRERIEKNCPKPELNATIQLATQFDAFDELMAGTDLKPKVVKPILLSREQEYVRQLALQGKSMFFTGSAGTGKSVLLRRIIKDLKAKHGPGTVAVTASTGLAAYHIGGITVHSFAGIGLGKGDVPSLIKMIRRNRKVLRRWRDTKVLIIDEISMIDGRLFDNLNDIARELRRKKNLPFGGLQVIACGDFYQLPPVSKTEIKADGTKLKELAQFTFESIAWKEALSSSIILKEVFRQKGDQTFIDMLNDLRHGRVSEEAAAEFLRLSRPLRCIDGILPTELYSTRYEVENANKTRLAKLGGNTRVYEAKDGGSLPPVVKNQMLQNFLAPDRLFLKENAQVMCIKNFDDTLVNGSLGKVKAFVDRDTYLCKKIMLQNPDLPFEEAQKLFAKHRVAHHLSQSTSQNVNIEDITDEMLDNAPEQLDSVFNFLHEDKNFKDLLPKLETEANPLKREHEWNSSPQAVSEEDVIKQNKRRKLEFISEVEKMAKGEKYPLVEFTSPDGLSSRTVLIEPERWDVVDENNEQILVSRVQLPLILAWAMSIHKSQGQTLSHVRVDLSRIFEKGHAYVALSRAVSRDNLQVVNFQTAKVETHPIVEKFYETLSTTEDLATDI